MRARARILPVLAASVLVIAGCNPFIDADARVERASQRMAEHDYRGAAIELQNALQSDPDHKQGLILLAEVLLKLSDPAGAESVIRRAMQGGASDEQTARLAAEAQLGLGQFDALLSQLEIRESTLTDIERSVYRGRALLGLHRYDEATEAFDAALQAGDTGAQARLGLAQSYFAQGRFSAALEELEKVATAEPKNSAALSMRGKVYVARGECNLAVTALNKARDTALVQMTLREQAELFTVLSESHLACGNIAEALSSKNELSRIAGDSPLTRVLAGRIAMARQDYAAAVGELQRVVNDVPEFTQGRFLLGAALFAQGNLNQAETHLSEVLKQAPENLEARKLLAQVRLRLQRPDAAVQALTGFEELVEPDPQVSALLDLAKLQRKSESASDLTGSHERDRQLASAMAHLRIGEASAALNLLTKMKPAGDDARREALMLASISATSGSAAAQAQMDQWLESRPNDEQLLNLAALLHAGQREFDDARASLRRALEIGKNDPATLLNAARIEVAAGEHDVAATHLEQILKSNPANQQAQLGLARLDLQAGDLESAALRLQIINKADPTAVDSRLLLAKVQMQLKRVGDADQTLQQAVAAAAGRADVLNAIGLLYLEVGRYDEAAARFRQTIAADTQQLAYRVNLARAQLALGQAVAARATLEEALKAQPNALEPSAALVLIDLRERRHAAAIERVERLKTARPNDPKVRLLEGDLHMALGRHSDAADAYSAVARVRPSSTVALKSYHARRMAGLKDATVPLESWIAQRPQDLFVRAALADAYQQAGKADLAIEQYEVLTNGPGANPITLNNLAWLYYEQDDARAELTAKRAYDLAPGNPAVADTYGWILVEKGKLAEGARILEQALLDADNAPDIGYHYAAALARLGDVAAARKRLSSLVVRPEAFASQKDARQLLDKLSAE